MASVLALCAAGAIQSCGRDAEAQQRAAANAAFDRLAEHDPEFGDALGRALLDGARESALGWEKFGPVLRGTLAERGRQAFLVVLEYGHCYRLLAAADASAVQDLDLVLFDARNVEVQRDIGEGPNVTLGVTAAICPSDASAMRIEARMRRGHGAYAIAVFRDPA